MRIKLDENLPIELAADLTTAGHDTDTVADEDLNGKPDTVILEAAKGAARILFTLDKGIANLVRHPQDRHAGVVLLRPGSLGRLAVLEFIRARLPQLLQRELENRVTVVSDTRIRFR
jgi:predicted nuclease of predicted toxin-antitoxin system